MNVLNLEHISKIYGDKVIFDDISCGIHQGATRSESSESMEQERQHFCGSLQDWKKQMTVR